LFCKSSFTNRGRFTFVERSRFALRSRIAASSIKIFFYIVQFLAGPH